MKKIFSEDSIDLLSKKWFSLTLFIFLFTYAFLRAWIVVPMLDELGTFFNYIQTGHYFKTIEILDANNHVLNSFFGHQYYRLFGDHFFLFRLTSLLSFPIYFFSAKYIVQTSLPKTTRLLVFLALICIPWFFEYFSYSRGYGTSIAFFFAAIAFILKWKTSNNWKHFTGIFICLWFSIASNLTYLFPSLLLLVYCELLFILERNFIKKRIFINLLIVTGWIATIIPFLKYSFKLKEAGALWWGNQDGLWETTGKSLSGLVLFTEEIWVFYLLLALLFICFYILVINWIKNGFWTYLKQTEAMVFILFIGSLTGIVLMRFILDMNYPMDRVGMYLVPFFILFIGVLLSKIKILKYALIGLIFFPLSFLYKMNLSTSIFSPEDRISTSFTNRIKANLKDEAALSAEYVSHFSYAYSCRKDKKVHFAFTTEDETNNYGDYHLSWLDCHEISGYSSIMQHPESHTCFMRRNKMTQKKLIVDTLIRNVDFKDVYFTILQRPIDTLLRDGLIQTEISGKMDFERPSRVFNIVQTTLNINNERVSSISPVFIWYFSDRTDINFVFTDRITKLKPEENKFQYFLYNNDAIQIKVKFIRVRIYKIIE